MPDAAAGKLTGHVLNFVNVVDYVKNLPSVKFLLHYCIRHIHRAGLMNINLLAAVELAIILALCNTGRVYSKFELAETNT